MARAIVLMLLLGWCGCFRGLDAVRGEAATPPSFTLEVRDHQAAVWPPSEIARRPVFVLRFADGALPRWPERHLFLLRGRPSEETLSDLVSSELRADTEARRIALQTTPSTHALETQPAVALEPGESYALVWVEAGQHRAFPLEVSSSPAAGAGLTHSLPAALERRVPPNLAQALLCFDGYLRGDAPRALHLLDASGAQIASDARIVSGDELGLRGGDCAQLVPQAELEHGARHRLVLGDGLLDATGAPIAPREIAFDTTEERDLRAPAWLSLDCARDELDQGGVCVLVSDTHVAIRARADENGVLSLSLLGTLGASLASSGDYALEAELTQPATGVLQLRDAAGNAAQLTLALSPARDLAAISIDEVRVDPRGPEPSQEYVELLNFGDTSMSIAGFTLSDDPRAAGQHIAGESSLAPRERVLVVGPDFDPDDGHDDAPAPGVRLLRLANPLSLRNEGVALYLRDASGRRVSASPQVAPEQAGQCIARHSGDKRSGKRADFRLDPEGGCTPGDATP